MFFAAEGPRIWYLSLFSFCPVEAKPFFSLYPGAGKHKLSLHRLSGAFLRSVMTGQQKKNQQNSADQETNPGPQHSDR